MEFSSLFAVINSAFDLGSAYLPGGLWHYCKGSNPYSLQICCNALNEVVSEYRGCEKDLKKQHIMAALLVKQQQQQRTPSGDQEKIEDWTVDNDLNYFEAVTTGLPNFSQEFLFDVIKRCGLTKQFCQLIGSCSKSFTSSICVDILRYIQIETDKLDIVLLSEFLEGLFLTSNMYMMHTENMSVNDDPSADDHVQRLRRYLDATFYAKNPVDFLDVVQEMVRSLQNTNLLWDCESRFKVKISLSLLALITSVSTGKVIVHCRPKEREMWLKRHIDLFKTMGCKTQEEFEKIFFYAQSLLRNEMWGSVSCSYSLEPSIVLDIIQCWNLLRNDFISLVFKTWKEDLADVALLCSGNGTPYTNSVENGQIYLPAVNLTMALLNCHEILPKYHLGDISKFCSEVKSIRLQLEGLVQTTYMPYFDILITQTAKAFVDLKFPGYEDHMFQLCQQSVQENLTEIEDWTQFLRRNLSTLTSRELRALLEQLSHTRQEYKLKVIHVFLDAYRRQKTQTKLEIMEHVLEYYDPEELFCVDGRFTAKLITVFNKLASITDFNKAVEEVCVLAIQSPDKTLYKVFTDATDSPGQQTFLVKLLQRIPVLCHCEEKTTRQNIPDILDQIFESVIHDKKRLANFIKLLPRLLKGHHLLHGTSILSPADFLQTTLLPRFIPEHEAKSMPQATVIELLITTLNCCDNIYWISQDQLFPALLFLFGVIDDHRILHEETIERSIKTKAAAIQALTQLKKSVNLAFTQAEKRLKWMYNSVQDLHWTTVLHLLGLYSSSDQFRVALPRSLAFVLLEWNDRCNFIIPDINTIDAVLLFGLVSDETTHVLLNEGKLNILNADTKLNVQLVISLTKILQNSTGPEWARAARIVKFLIQTDILQASLKAVARDTIPCINVKDIKVVLGTCQIFWETLVILSRTSTSFSRNVLLCKEYVNITKAVLEELKAGTIEECYVLSHEFCKLCFLLSEFQPECTECLFVMMLDLMKRHIKIRKDILKNGGNELLVEINNQDAAMQIAVKQTPNFRQETLNKEV